MATIKNTMFEVKCLLETLEILYKVFKDHQCTLLKDELPKSNSDGTFDLTIPTEDYTYIISLSNFQLDKKLTLEISRVDNNTNEITKEKEDIEAFFLHSKVLKMLHSLGVDIKKIPSVFS